MDTAIEADPVAAVRHSVLGDDEGKLIPFSKELRAPVKSRRRVFPEIVRVRVACGELRHSHRTPCACFDGDTKKNATSIKIHRLVDDFHLRRRKFWRFRTVSYAAF